MQAAGLSIAFHAKPAVQEQAMLSIVSGGMDRALALLQG
jgi:phosphoserine phosphatase